MCVQKEIKRLILIITKETYMAIYSFSTSTKRPTEDVVVKEIKELCEKRGLNFSHIVVAQLTKWLEERKA